MWKKFDNLGFMLYQGVTDIETIYNLAGGLNLLLYWEKFGAVARVK